MPFGVVRLTPGVDQTKTPTLNEAAISVSQLVRFSDGLVEKMGGWVQFCSVPVESGGTEPSVGEATGTGTATGVSVDFTLYVGAYYFPPQLRVSLNGLTEANLCSRLQEIDATDVIEFCSVMFEDEDYVYYLDGSYDMAYRLSKETGLVNATIDMRALNANFRGWYEEWGYGAAKDDTYIYWAGGTGSDGGSLEVPQMARIHLSDFATVDFVAYATPANARWLPTGGFVANGWFYVGAQIRQNNPPGDPTDTYPLGFNNIIRIDISGWTTVEGLEVEAEFYSAWYPSRQMFGAVTDGTYGYFGSNADDQSAENDEFGNTLYDPITILDLANFTLGGITTVNPQDILRTAEGAGRPARHTSHIWLDDTYLYALYWKGDSFDVVNAHDPYIVRIRLSDHALVDAYRLNDLYTPDYQDCTRYALFHGEHHYILFRNESGNDRSMVMRLPQDLGGGVEIFDILACNPADYVHYNALLVGET